MSKALLRTKEAFVCGMVRAALFLRLLKLDLFPFSCHPEAHFQLWRPL